MVKVMDFSLVSVFLVCKKREMLLLIYHQGERQLKNRMMILSY